MRSAMYHDSSRIQPKLGREYCVEKKKRQDLTSMAVPQNQTISAIVHKLHRKEFSSIMELINSKDMKSAKNAVVTVFISSQKKKKELNSVTGLEVQGCSDGFAENQFSSAFPP